MELGITVGERRQTARARAWIEIDDLVETCPDFLPALRIHWSESPLRSTASHARAERSSRLVVASETPSAAALSSRDKPPKYRYCSRRPCRGLSCARRESASSSSAKLSRFSSENSPNSSSS